MAGSAAGPAATHVGAARARSSAGGGRTPPRRPVPVRLSLCRPSRARGTGGAVGAALHAHAAQQHRLCGERPWPGAGTGAGHRSGHSAVAHAVHR
ncbi:hypothetical protein G6F62_015035 [Rhizopus arrhizus]|nr:hypothetical protein G6F62_015035 [Rhizopus arrhizus]